MRRSPVPRALVAVALLVSAWVHATLPAGPVTAGGRLTLAGLFLAQAVVAGLAAGWLLLLPSRAAWAAAAVVGLGSLAAVVLSTYVPLPAVGPVPALHDPDWYRVKVLAAVSAALAGAGALAGLRPRPRR